MAIYSIIYQSYIWLMSTEVDFYPRIFIQCMQRTVYVQDRIDLVLLLGVLTFHDLDVRLSFISFILFVFTVSNLVNTESILRCYDTTG